MMNEFEKWQVKWGEKKEILISIGIIPYGYDPGIAARINDVSVDLPDSLIEIICNLVKIKNDLLAACKMALIIIEDEGFTDEIKQLKTAIEKAEDK